MTTDSLVELEKACYLQGFWLGIAAATSRDSGAMFAEIETVGDAAWAMRDMVKPLGKCALRYEAGVFRFESTETPAPPAPDRSTSPPARRSWWTRTRNLFRGQP